PPARPPERASTAEEPRRRAGQSLRPDRDRTLDTTAISTPVMKMSVPMTFTWGGSPTRVAPQIHNGKVVVVPAVKLVTTKSSIDSANASIMPEATAGRMIGKVIRQNVVHGLAPRSAAASSMDRSRVSTRARPTTETKEDENRVWA